MLTSLVPFLIMLNPFALFLYLQPIMDDLTHDKFMHVLFKATAISTGVFALFVISSDFLFERVFMIHFDSFRIFGGIIIFSYAYYFIIKGGKALIFVKENLDDLASEIALPFMVGPGTISLAILLSYEFPIHMGLVGLGIVMLANYLILTFLKHVRDGINKKMYQIAFDKHMGLLLRINAFFVGAIGVDMVLRGILNMF